MQNCLEGLVDKKVLAIFNSLIKDPQKLFHLNSLSKEAKIPVSTTFRIINKLVKHSLVEEIKVGKVSIYKLADNPKNKVLKQLYFLKD